MKLAPLFVVLCACGSGQNFGGNEPPEAGGTKSDAATDAPSPPKNDAGTTTQDAGPPTGQPTLEMVSGNGGTVPSGWPATDPVRVRARDAQGNPVRTRMSRSRSAQGRACTCKS